MSHNHYSLYHPNLMFPHDCVQIPNVNLPKDHQVMYKYSFSNNNGSVKHIHFGDKTKLIFQGPGISTFIREEEYISILHKIVLNLTRL